MFMRVNKFQMSNRDWEAVCISFLKNKEKYHKTWIRMVRKETVDNQLMDYIYESSWVKTSILNVVGSRAAEDVFQRLIIGRILYAGKGHVVRGEV